VYVLVVTMLERYYTDFDSNRLIKLRKHVIPFAQKLFTGLSPEAFAEIREATAFFRTHYPSNHTHIHLTIFLEILNFDSIDGYLGYYERKKVIYDNLCRETKRSDCRL
jgi:hypothetical protein